MTIGLVAMGAGVINPLVLMVPAFFHSIGAGLSVPNSVAGAVGSAPDRAGAASGLLGFIQFLTAAVTTQIAGFLPHDEAAPVLIGMTVLATIGVVGFLALERGVEAEPVARS
jgi:DHA1 family bicyclomycin/chloramphenicol resistance-like MFS transporter